MSHQSGETLNNKISWQFHNSQLLKILNIAWHSLSPGSSKEAISNIQTILTVFNPDSIPYRNSAGKYKHRLSTYNQLIFQSRQVNFLHQRPPWKSTFNTNTQCKRWDWLLLESVQYPLFGLHMDNAYRFDCNWSTPTVAKLMAHAINLFKICCVCYEMAIQAIAHTNYIHSGCSMAHLNCLFNAQGVM